MSSPDDPDPSGVNNRPSPIAGQWYENNPLRLASQINTLLEQIHPEIIDGEIVALVVPHAGHAYSGLTAAYGYKTIQHHDIELAIIVSPMHRPINAPFITSGHPAYETPLGVIPIHQEALQQVNQSLKAKTGSQITPVMNDQEHSIEIQLPFLQQALTKPFHLLPIMISTYNPDHCRALGEAIAEISSRYKSILIASTDLSHFFPESTANQLDTEMINQIVNLSPSGVLNAEKSGKGYACGAPAVASVLWAAVKTGANQAKLIHYSTSANQTGDYHRVVGYGSIVITRRKAENL